MQSALRSSSCAIALLLSLSKQAAWTVSVTPNENYLLTYQPALISAWVLHPQNDEPNRKTLLTLIENTLAKQPTTQKVS